MAFKFESSKMANDALAEAHIKAYATDLNTLSQSITSQNLTFENRDAMGKIALASENYDKLMKALQGKDKTYPKAKAALQLALKAKNNYTTLIKNAQEQKAVPSSSNNSPPQKPGTSTTVNQYANASNVKGKPPIKGPGTGGPINPTVGTKNQYANTPKSNAPAINGPGGNKGPVSQYANKPNSPAPTTNQYANAPKPMDKPSITGGPQNPMIKGIGTAPGLGGKPSINPQAQKPSNQYGKVPGKPNPYGKVPKV